MNIYIGENIKRLRKEKNTTQEKLAEYLNISCQAISKWERNETLPDITLVIPLASYFNVSTDELLGVDNARNEEKINRYLLEFDRLKYLAKDKEAFDLIQRAYKEFPNDFKIMDKYLWMLFYDPYAEVDEKFRGASAHIDEMKMLCERILDDCKDYNIRFEALKILCDIYSYQGKEDKVLEITNTLPEEIKRKWLELSARGTDKWWPQVRSNIYCNTLDLFYDLRNCANSSGDTPKIKLKQYQRVADFIKLVYEDGDYGFAHEQLAQVYYSMALIYKDLCNIEKACEYIELCLNHAKEYDELGEITVHTSFWVRDYEFKKTDVYSGCEENTVAYYLKDAENSFKSISDTDEFKNIIKKYKPFAKNSK